MRESSHVLVARDEHASAEPLREYVVDAHGGRLLDASILPLVDWTRCYSNDVHEVCDTLGISAAVEMLFCELSDVISFDGTYVFSGHIMMIVDTIAREGRLKALNRFGVNREHSNALARSSYEETPEVLTEAAIFAENSRTTGVSTNIMLGQRADMGTGVVDVRFHTRMLPIRMQASSSLCTQIAKTTVRPRNVDEPEEEVQYALGGGGAAEEEEEAVAAEAAIAAPYAAADAARPPAPSRHRARGGVDPPFVVGGEEEDGETWEDAVVRRPFRIHSPGPSDDDREEEEPGGGVSAHALGRAGRERGGRGEGGG